MASDPEAPISFPALVVAEVDEKLLHSNGQGRLNTSNLPVKHVTLPVPDMLKVAILSWRWDTARPGPSLNIIAAVRHARSTEIDYLFIDIISIDQNRSSNDLVQDVLVFSKLYEIVPVIVVYDLPNEDFYKTLRRPWILFEKRKYSHNPYTVTFINRFPNNRESTMKYLEWDASIYQEEKRTSYTSTILGVLTGEIGMAIISDFKLLLPAYAYIFNVAYQKMGRNDYLLTLALLCQAATQPISLISKDQIEGTEKTRGNTLATSTFTRYRVVRRVQGSNYHHFDIFLDGQKVAKWMVPQNSGKGPARCILAAMEMTEYFILRALGLEDALASFVKNEATRKKCLNVGRDREGLPFASLCKHVKLDDIYFQDAKEEK